MREAVDLYGKLLIATFGFIGPSFSLLIPIFYEAIGKSKRKHERDLERWALVALSAGKNRYAGIVNLSRNLREAISQNRKELNLLNPRRQIKRLFGGLLISVLAVFVYYSGVFGAVNSHNNVLINVLFVISITGYVYCLRTLWQIFCTVVTVKSEQESVKAEFHKVEKIDSDEGV